MQAYEGYFENGRFYITNQPTHIKGRRRAFITILDEPAQEIQTHSQKQLVALKRFIEANKLITDEPIDEEFDGILASGLNMRELDL